MTDGDAMTRKLFIQQRTNQCPIVGNPNGDTMTDKKVPQISALFGSAPLVRTPEVVKSIRSTLQPRSSTPQETREDRWSKRSVQKQWPEYDLVKTGEYQKSALIDAKDLYDRSFQFDGERWLATTETKDGGRWTGPEDNAIGHEPAGSVYKSCWVRKRDGSIYACKGG